MMRSGGKHTPHRWRKNLAFQRRFSTLFRELVAARKPLGAQDERVRTIEPYQKTLPMKALEHRIPPPFVVVIIGGAMWLIARDAKGNLEVT
jgi:hypothetical protein